MKLRVRGEGSPVVKLAGLAGGCGLYEEEMIAAARAGFRVAALDTTGDRRDDPSGSPVTWNRLTGEVVAALDEIGVERAVLWGTSFGCVVALAAAAAHPDRVSGLLLSHPPDPTWRPRPYVRALSWATARRYPNLTARLLFSGAFVTMTGWEALAPGSLVRIPGLLRAAIEAATPARTVREKLELLFLEPPPALPRVPVSIIAGRWDPVAPLARARRLAANLPDSRLVVMEYSGHAGAYSRPRTYTRLVLQELLRLSDRPG